MKVRHLFPLALCALVTADSPARGAALNVPIIADTADPEDTPAFALRYLSVEKFGSSPPRMCAGRDGMVRLCWEPEPKRSKRPQHKRKRKHDVPLYEENEADQITGGVPCAGFMSNRGGSNKSHSKAIRHMFKFRKAK